MKDIGLRAPFNGLIPLVEVFFSTPINRVPASQTIGTIQPGIIWAGTYFQIGAEAIIPATRLTGHGYGGVVQLHFYLDDLFPTTLGRLIVYGVLTNVHGEFKFDLRLSPLNGGPGGRQHCAGHRVQRRSRVHSRAQWQRSAERVGCDVCGRAAVRCGSGGERVRRVV